MEMIGKRRMGMGQRGIYPGTAPYHPSDDLAPRSGSECMPPFPLVNCLSAKLNRGAIPD